jgi:hypothetical protein
VEKRAGDEWVLVVGGTKDNRGERAGVLGAEGDCTREAWVCALRDGREGTRESTSDFSFGVVGKEAEGTRGA